MSSPESTIEILFTRFRRDADAAALAAAFDRSAVELGRVAMYLTGGDAHRAADGLQATWLSAITHARNWDAERPLLPWLLGMLANHVRGQQRATRREHGGAAGAEALATLLASDDPVRASEDGEFQRLLAEALAELPSPFREAVALHVQHGLTAKEIGAALGRPAGTVRTQIVRGLERLRQRLPVGLAGAGIVLGALSAAQVARVRDAVLAAAPPPVAPFAAARAWSVALLLAAIVAMAFAFVMRDQAAPLPLAAQAAPAMAALGNGNERDASARVAIDAPPQEPRPVAERKPRRRITVQVRREEDPKVVAGEYVCLNLGEVRLATTDAHGNAVFDDVPPALAHFVFLSGVGESTSVAAPRLPPPDEFDITATIDVRGGEPLCVRVVDAGGRPVTGAEVEGNGAQNAERRWLPLGRTDERGELRLRSQSLGQYRARAEGHGNSSFAAPKPEAGAHVCSLTLGPGIAPLHGRVLDVDGEPIAAELGSYEFGDGAMAPWYDRTDARGAFTFAWLGAGHVAVVARVVDAKGTRIAIARVDVPRREPLEIRLLPAARLDVRATLADGAAIQAIVSGRLLADGAFELPFSRPQLRTHADGRLTVHGLTAGRWHFEVDYGQSRVERTFDLVAGQAVSWEAQSAPLVGLPLRVLDERRAPLPHWRVRVLDAKGHALGGQGMTMETGEPHPAIRTFRLPADQPFTVAVCEAYEDGGSLEFPVHRVPGIVATGACVDIVVPDDRRTAHFVRGRLVDVQGRAVAGRVCVQSPQMDWHWLSAPAAADGAFRVGPLPPGRYPAAVDRDGLPRYRLGRIEVPREGDVDLGDVVLAREVCVRATPAGRAGVPDDLRVQLVREDGGDELACTRGDGGVFVGDAVRPGRYALRGSSRSHVVTPQTITVGADDLAVTFQCEPAPTLRIEIPLLDDERAQSGWSGTIVLRRGNEDVLRRHVSRRFHGRVPTPFVVELAAAPGNYTVVVDWANARELRGTCELGERGAVVTFSR